MIAQSSLNGNSCKHKKTLPERTNLFERMQSIFDSSLSIQQKLLLIRIALYAGDDGECFASAKTLQRDLSVSRSRLYALLSSVEHLIKTEIRGGRAYRSIRWDREFTPIQPARQRPAVETFRKQDIVPPVCNTGESSAGDFAPYIEQSTNTQRTHIIEEPVFLNRFEQQIDHSIDWLVAENEFMTSWNSTVGVSRRDRPALPGDLKLTWMRLWSDEGWRLRAMRALHKFPLKNGSIISLKRFLNESTVDDILSGVYDFEKGKDNDAARFPNGSGGDGWSDFEAKTKRSGGVRTG